MIAHKNIGEKNLNDADRLKQFLDRIDEYIELKNVQPPKDSMNQFKEAEGLSLDNLDKLTQDECFNYAFMMYQYADHVASEKAKQETAVRWCERNLNSIVSAEIQNFTDSYLKHEIKVAHILRRNELARKIDEWKSVAEARLANLTSREYNVRRKGDILIDKGRKR